MKKRTFLKKLKENLYELSDEELNDILDDYDKLITDKIKNGMSEEDAVKSFGDPSWLSEELLKTAKSVKKNKNSEVIDIFSEKLRTTYHKIINMVAIKTPKEILRMVVEIFLILLLISFCYYPVSFLSELGKNVFNILPSPFNRFFYYIWNIVLEFSYFYLSIYSFIKIFDVRYLKSYDLPNDKIKKDENSVILKYIVFILKLFSSVLIFGISIYCFVIFIILMLCLYLLIHGVTYFGIYIIMFALLYLGVILFILLYNFIIDKPNNGIKLIIRIIILIVLLVVGVFISTYEVENTEFVNGPPKYIKTDVLTEELTMDKNTVFVANVADFIVDEEEENVKVLYEYYPVGTMMATDIYKEGNFVHLGYKIKNIYYKNLYLKQLIKDLSEKKVYNYYIEPTIKIVSNSDNINIIKKNRQKYYSEAKNYFSCEFTRTYYVDLIKATKEDDYVNVALSSNDELGTVKLKKSIAKDIMVGSYYEFHFKTYQAYIDTSLDSIFSENEISSINITNKDSKDFINEDTCSIFY